MKLVAKKSQMIPLQGAENCNLQADAKQYSAERCNRGHHIILRKLYAKEFIKVIGAL